MSEQQERDTRLDRDDGLDEEQRASGGGLRYQQAFRDPEQTRAGVTPADVANPDVPDLRQRATEYGGPDAAEEATLQEQGYPKLGRTMQAKVTQVEHGPYAGGTQQGESAEGPAGMTGGNGQTEDNPEY